ncbi:MAG: purine-binding chemotaxis protein CheW [Salinivirgaceae bacterium]|nr:purine-binding chemotaxis protein CheW [Salinivirgaceae bacterium]
MEELIKYFVFYLDSQMFAILLHRIETIVLMVEIDPLPKVPEYILGAINYHGDIIPVVNLRKLFALPDKQVELSDHLIIVKTPKQTIALWVDALGKIIERGLTDISKSTKFFYKTDSVSSVTKLDDKIVLIQDLDKLLSENEITLLQHAINQHKKNTKSTM